MEIWKFRNKKNIFYDPQSASRENTQLHAIHNYVQPVTGQSVSGNPSVDNPAVVGQSISGLLDVVVITTTTSHHDNDIFLTSSSTRRQLLLDVVINTTTTSS
uniref:Uncharacterized protein n=1 Tax=Meloidogyne incognita TaxID=6306 RepID=A0A914MQG5_MELIC